MAHLSVFLSEGSPTTQEFQGTTTAPAKGPSSESRKLKNPLDFQGPLDKTAWPQNLLGLQGVWGFSGQPGSGRTFKGCQGAWGTGPGHWLEGCSFIPTPRVPTLSPECGMRAGNSPAQKHAAGQGVSIARLPSLHPQATPPGGQAADTQQRVHGDLAEGTQSF